MSEGPNEGGIQQPRPPHLPQPDSEIDFAEGCILTNSIQYTHKLTYWVNLALSGDPSELEYVIEKELGIIPYEDFTIHDRCNVTYLEASIRSSLEEYAFIALTPSASTLHGLIEMVKVRNNRLQRNVDDSGFDDHRKLNLLESLYFTNPEFELVAIHPEHFLPCGSVLPVFHSTTPTMYVPSRDRRLRKTSEPNSSPLPPFCNITKGRVVPDRLNVFLVALNAEIKFHRYLHMIKRNPPTTPLPDDVLALMHLTMELVDLIYWKPIATKGSQGEEVFYNETLKHRQSSKLYKRKSAFPEGMNQEQRKEYGRTLMGGHDYVFDDQDELESAILTNDGTEEVAEA